MRMVSNKLNAKLLIAAGALLLPAPAFASPYLDKIIAAYGGGGNEPRCNDQSQEKEKKNAKCESSCVTEVTKQKQNVEKALKGAKIKDGLLVANAKKAGAAGAGAMANAPGAKNGMKTGSGVMGNASENLGKQAGNARELVQPLQECSTQIEEKCKADEVGDQAAEDAKKVADKCEAAKNQAEQSAGEKDKEAKEAEKNEKKGEENGKGMEPPKMPEMPKQEPKQAQPEQPKPEEKKPEKVADSSLGGNQLKGNTPTIGGEDGSATEDSKSKTASFGNYQAPGFDSGVSSSKDNGMFTGAAGTPHNSSGSSSMGGGLGGGSSGGEGSGSGATAAAPALPGTSEVEGYSSGSARPSFLGMKAKGDGLSDLGLDGATASNLASSDAAAAAGEGDRSLASDQNEGIHTEDNGGTIFNMIHFKLKELGRGGRI